MIYSFTGKLGVGVDPVRYVRIQKSLKKSLDQEFSKSGLSATELEVNYCPVINTEKNRIALVEKSEYDSDSKVLFLSNFIDSAKYARLYDEDLRLLLLEGVRAGAEILQKANVSKAVVEAFSKALLRVEQS